jgi:hypothetical protein
MGGRPVTHRPYQNADRARHQIQRQRKPAHRPGYLGITVNDRPATTYLRINPGDIAPHPVLLTEHPDLRDLDATLDNIYGGR